MATKPKRKKKKEPPLMERVKAAALEHGCDMTEEEFKAVVKKVGRKKKDRESR